MFFKSKKVVGLDIGTSSIKMAEVEIVGKGARLLSFGFAPTPAGCLSNGAITNSMAISSSIQNLAAEIKTKRRLTSVGMWGTSVIIKKITIPKVEKKVLAEQIRFEAEQYIPFDISEIKLGHHVLPSSSPDSMDVLLIAAQNEILTQYAAAISGAGLESSVVDVSGFALANCFELNYGKRRDETIALLNIGAGVTNFVVLHSGEVIFCRDIAVGGMSYTNEVHKEMGISVPEAEALKMSAIQGDAVPDEVHKIMRATTDAISDELRSGFDFFSQSSSGLSIQSAFYAGGGSGMPTLIKIIGEKTNIRFEQLNPFLRVASNLKNNSRQGLQQIAPFAPVVIGLALRSVGDA